MTDNVGFLLADVSRLLRRRFDVRAAAIGVTRAQWRTLTVLSRNEGANQGQLAELLEVEPITLCRMIDRLAEAGHVERRRDPADRRAWNIYLTDRSRPLLDRLRLIGESVIADALGGVDTDTRAALARAVDRMRHNLTTPDLAEHAHG